MIDSSNLIIEENNKMNADIDIENQYDNIRLSSSDTSLKADTSLKEPLKGILKKQEQFVINRKIIEQRIMKLCISLIFIIEISPILICDLYFGFTDISCSKKKPDELNFSMRLYLLVSGFMALLILIGSLILIWIPSDINNELKKYIWCYGGIFYICISLFQLIWNVFGAVVFWVHIYGNKFCSKNFSTYMFITLIIKLIISLFAVQYRKKDN